MARKWFAFLLTVERFLKRFRLRAPLRLPWRSSAFKKYILLVFHKFTDDKTAETQRALKKKMKRVWAVLFLIGFLLAFGISPVLSQAPTSIVQIVREGKIYYDKGQYQQAIEKLQQAINNFEKTGNTLNQAVTLSNISLAYQELGEWQEAEKTINQSLQIIGFDSQKPQITGINTQNLKILAPSLDIYGKLLFKRSQPDNALNYWRLAAKIYQQLNDNSGLIQNQINQVQALQSLGLYQQAKVIVGQIEQNVETLPAALKTQALLSLGDILRATGDLKGSQTALEEALTINKDKPAIAAKTWLSLGNTFYARANLERERRASQTGDRNQQTPKIVTPWQCTINTVPSEAIPFYEQADKAYQKVIDLQSDEFSTKAQLNRFSLLTDTGKFTTALQASKNINLSKLSPSRTKVYAQINLARELACLNQQPQLTNQVTSWQEIDNILKDSVQTAETLADKRAKSYAIGNRGSLYEYLAIKNQIDSQNKTNSKNQNLKTAQKLTSEALLLAQPSQAPSIAYQWQWQLGRLANIQGDKPKAVANYQAAVNTLELVRDDLLSINSDVQFSFRDNVEPVYRQLVNLLLTNTENGSLPQKNLTSAINLIDSLQLAELENFLRCNLASVARNQQNTQIGKNAAFIYPIILENRLEVVYKLPGEQFKSFSNSVTRNEVEKTAQKLRKAIAKRDTETANENSQTVYQWLIKPLETELEKNQAVETLVFVLDTELRNIPMAVLYDQKNKEYLVEKKYALSVLPTSQLFNLRPSSEKLKILAGGISEALEVENRQFEAINAKEELNQISELASTQSLLNQQFNQKALQQKLKNENFSVLHLATHGNFSSDPEQTYILAYNELLRPNDINRLLSGENRQTSNRIELLVLSACQTASGDNRATLGLAGLAVRAGADSTLATLWKVNDEFTIKLIERFYQELNAGVSKAEALHRAQKALVFAGKYRNEPYDWGAYILVGNWL
ncbi:CHAT domain-containing protein [Calothrix sp. CCY 0018]|uniref:CHAT domain-containing protein n=1 Tax=Calothrix sp. CCY 0018 TaxID=3103864 RepID=UPI0039C65ED7